MTGVSSSKGTLFVYMQTPTSMSSWHTSNCNYHYERVLFLHFIHSTAIEKAWEQAGFIHFAQEPPQKHLCSMAKSSPVISLQFSAFYGIKYVMIPSIETVRERAGFIHTGWSHEHHMLNHCWWCYLTSGAQSPKEVKVFSQCSDAASQLALSCLFITANS